MVAVREQSDRAAVVGDAVDDDVEFLEAKVGVHEMKKKRNSKNPHLQHNYGNSFYIFENLWCNIQQN